MKKVSNEVRQGRFGLHLCCHFDSKFETVIMKNIRARFFPTLQIRSALQSVESLLVELACSIYLFVSHVFVCLYPGWNKVIFSSFLIKVKYFDSKVWFPETMKSFKLRTTCVKWNLSEGKLKQKLIGQRTRQKMFLEIASFLFLVFSRSIF